MKWHFPFIIALCVIIFGYVASPEGWTFDNYRIVQFSDGKYALRKGHIFYTYKDIHKYSDGTVNRYWWEYNPGDAYFENTKGTLEEIKAAKEFFVDHKKLKEKVIE